MKNRVTIIADEASRAARIVQNMLLFSRHYPPERRPCSLADQVRRVYALKEYQLRIDADEGRTECEDCPAGWPD